jgi:hypothetical protein
MKYKTSELDGKNLDAAVEKALYANDKKTLLALESVVSDGVFSPSTNWSHGGPIIEREQIAVMMNNAKGDSWYANVGAWLSHDLVCTPEYGVGSTPLIAAMRAFVLARLGDEVEL